MPTILAFGNFDLVGARCWVLRTGLAEHGWRVELCRTEKPGFIAKYRDLSRQWNSYKGELDAVYVPFLGHYLMPLAWWLAKRRKVPVVLDAFLSLYDTEVQDRRRVGKYSPKALVLWLTDWLACSLATVVLVDTEEHKEYFVRTFGIRPEKILALPIGSRTDIFKPAEKPRQRSDGTFHVHFHGTYIPLQGIDTILHAAELVQRVDTSVRFHMIGKGQTFAESKALAERLQLENTEFIGAMPMEELRERIVTADVSLGIFGKSEKADRVIPNKAYEVLACGAALITGETTAARRVLKNEENALLVTPHDSQALAEGILRLKKESALKERIAAGGLRLSQERFLPAMIVSPLSDWLSKRQ
jgi:glycosyltransferase involved in cell wall biosynthesis